MAPKKDKGAADPKAAEGVEPSENPGTLLVNYTKFCKCVEGGKGGQRRPAVERRTTLHS